MTPFAWYLVVMAIVAALSGCAGWVVAGFFLRRREDAAHEAFGTPRRCRWFGHAWAKGLPELGGPVLYCERPECKAQLRWPPPPLPVRMPPGTIIGTALEHLRPGELVVALNPCGKPPPDGMGGEGCTRPAGHAGGCGASHWGSSPTTLVGPAGGYGASSTTAPSAVSYRCTCRAVGDSCTVCGGDPRRRVPDGQFEDPGVDGAVRWCPDCATKQPYVLGDRWTCIHCGETWVRGPASELDESWLRGVTPSPMDDDDDAKGCE